MSSNKAGPSRLASTAGRTAARPAPTAAAASGARKVSAKAPEPPAASSSRDANNIKVVVRCRGRSQMEMDAKTPVIAKTDGPVSDSVTIDTTVGAASASAYPAASLPFSDRAGVSKTYAFDKVFGPEADQTLVYKEVVEDMLDQVLSGYNCAIFAYGQTGTGKTYTMQGETGLTALKTPVADAGVIPRTLHRLFARLQIDPEAEYAVKCSYVELYNEELRDLLAPEYKGGELRIYEEKKGVTIQGLEEANIASTSDGLALLQKGSQRRQVAETKMNTESSRSHTIFTLTVHTKEATGRGTEELLRVGKFHLVDLAGSEAIGRSGAENKRAREAGMINQSLLTLGRVISALVDRSSHVPYRESKLTRLLQDALGGKTKTCIIATISPTRSNMEETMSTLEYALRAKSICNKPEVNQKTTKGALIKDYLTEIDKLKADLLACHEKNGIWFSNEHWKELSAEHDDRRNELDDTKQRAKTIELRHQSLQDEFQQNMAVLVEREEALQEMTRARTALTAANEKLDGDLRNRSEQLYQERYVSNKFELGEQAMQAVAQNLKQLLKASAADLDAVFAKTDRLKVALQSNSATTTTTVGTIDQLLNKNLAAVRGIQETASRLVGQIREQSVAQLGENITALGGQRAELEAGLASVEQGLQSLADDLANSSDQARVGVQQLHGLHCEAQHALKTHLDEESRETRATTERLTKAGDALAHQLSVVDQRYQQSVELLTGVALEEIQNHHSLTLGVLELYQGTADQEISRLREQNNLLAEGLTRAKAHGTELSRKLVSSIAALVDEFAATQQAGFEGLVTPFTTSNNIAIDSFESLDFEAKRSKADALAESSRMGMADAGQKAGEVSKLIETAATQSVSTTASVITDMRGTAARTKGLSNSIGEAEKQWQEVSQNLLARLEQAKIAQLDRVRTAASQVVTSSGKVRNDLSGLESGMRAQQQQLSSQMDMLAPAVGADIDVVKQVITETQAETGRLKGALVDVTPSGLTPVKKASTSPVVASQVGKREDLVARFNLKMAQKKAAANASVPNEGHEAGEAMVNAGELDAEAERVVLKEKAANVVTAAPQLSVVDDKPTLKRSISKAMDEDKPIMGGEDGGKKRVARTRTTRA